MSHDALIEDPSWLDDVRADPTPILDIGVCGA